MVSKRIIEITLDSVAAILIVKAIDISPFGNLFNDKYYIPLLIGLVIIGFAPQIANKIGN